jgi:hypothetical protein
MSPIEGHLKAAKRILSYLKTFPKERVIIDHSNWMEFYPDAGEEIPKNHPTEKDQGSS